MIFETHDTHAQTTLNQHSQRGTKQHNKTQHDKTHHNTRTEDTLNFQHRDNNSPHSETKHGGLLKKNLDERLCKEKALIDTPTRDPPCGLALIQASLLLFCTCFANQAVPTRPFFFLTCLHHSQVRGSPNEPFVKIATVAQSRQVFLPSSFTVQSECDCSISVHHSGPTTSRYPFQPSH